MAKHPRKRVLEPTHEDTRAGGMPVAESCTELLSCYGAAKPSPARGRFWFDSGTRRREDILIR